MASYVGNVQAGANTHLVASTLYGTCNSSASAQTKNVTIDNCDAVLLGMTIHVKFTNTNTYVADSEHPMLLKLNNVATSYPICTDGNNLSPGNSALTSWRAGSVVSFTFDGASWMMNNVGLNSTCQADVQTTTPSSITDLLKYIYPIGSIYISTVSTSPATLFGGTWVQIPGQFLLTAGTTPDTQNTYTAGSTGGVKSVTLTTGNLPSHNHEVGAHTHAIGEHTHEVAAHSHSLSSHTHTVGNHTHGLSGHTHGWPGGVGSLHGDNGLGDVTRTKVQVNTASGRFAFLGKAGATTTDNSNLVYASGTGGPNPNSTDAGGAQTSSGPSINSTDTLAAFQTANPASGDTGENEAFASGNTGSGTSFDILPPYLVVYAWRRTQL